MPGIELRDVEGCKRYSSYNQSPSELLLRIWSSKGYSTTHLYQLFAKTKLIRLMRMMRSQGTTNCCFYYKNLKFLIHSTWEVSLFGEQGHKFDVSSFETNGPTAGVSKCVSFEKNWNKRVISVTSSSSSFSVIQVILDIWKK